MVFDITLDKVDNTRFDSLYTRYIIQLSKDSIFSRTEITCHMMVYHKFVLVNGSKAKYMRHSQFLTLLVDFFLLPDPKIAEYVLSVVATHEKYLLPVDWIDYFSLIMSDDLEIRMKFAFKVYDFARTGYLSMDELGLRVYSFFSGPDDDDESSELRSDMLELIMAKFDQDHDNNISFQEYADVVRKSPMLLEFLGPVFPSKETCEVIGICANLKKYDTHQD